MRDWLLLLAGLLLWAAHFFLLYGIGEFAGSGTGARLAVGLATLGALAAAGLLLRRTARRGAADPFGNWRRHLSRGGLLLGGLAIIWQALPALLS